MSKLYNVVVSTQNTSWYYHRARPQGLHFTPTFTIRIQLILQDGQPENYPILKLACWKADIL